MRFCVIVGLMRINRDSKTRWRKGKTIAALTLKLRQS
jgi:hypothetical protein